MSEYNRHRWAMEWMYGGGRDPHGRSLDEEIRIGKEDWMERQRVAAGGRIGFDSGQLVQPGPGRQGYQGEALPSRLLKEKKIKIRNSILEKIKDPFAKINVNDYVKEFRTTEATVKEVIEQLKKEGHKIRTGLGAPFKKAQTDYFLKNYKSLSLSEMAKNLSKKGISGKELFNTYQQLAHIRRYAIENNIVNPKKLFVGKGKPRKIKTQQWQAIDSAMKKLMKKDPSLKNLTPGQLEYRLQKLTNFHKIRNALDPRLKPDSPLLKTKTQKGVKIWPSFEHTQGKTPSIIIDDPEGLRKVRVSTQKFNFDILGANDKKGLYKRVKDSLKFSKAALKNGQTIQAIDYLSEVNQIYHKLADKLKLKRTDLPLYYIDGNTIKEKNVKGVIKQETLYKSFLKYLKEAAVVSTDTDIKRIHNIQPNLSQALKLLKDGKTEKATKFIKLRMPAVQAGELFS